MRVDWIKLGLSGLMLTTLFSPISTMALESSTPIKSSIEATPIDVSVPSSIQITSVAGKTDATIPEYAISNNSNVGIVTISNTKIAESNPWSLDSYDLDFNKIPIDSKKVALNYNNHDMQTSYTTPQSIDPNTSLPMKFKAKTSISSTDVSEKIAEMVVTLGYVEEVYLDTLKVEYTEQESSVTEIKPEYLKVTAVYTDGTERILNEKEYTITTLTGTGEENVKVSYSEKGVIKEAVFIVNNPYTVTLISDGDENQIIQYKFGTGKLLPVPTRNGYTFKGWYENSSFEGTAVTQIDSSAKGNKTFYAKWEEIISELANTSELRKRLADYVPNTTKLEFIKGAPNVSNPVANIDVSGKNDNSIIATILNDSSISGKYHVIVNSKGTIMAPSNCSGMFKGFTFYSEDVSYYFENLELINFENFKTSKVTNMDSFLFGCRKLSNIQGIENFDTSNVTNMGNMFNYNYILTSIESLQNWDVSNVTSMKQMFTECYKLSSVSALEKWNVSKVENTSFMFWGCSGITTFENLNKWNVSNVTDMNSMFNGESPKPAWYTGN